MLVLRVDLNDLKHLLPKMTLPLHFGNSKIEYFCSPIIQTSIERIEKGFWIWIGEDDDPYRDIQDIDLRISKYSLHTDCEGIAIFLQTKNNNPTISLVRTYQGTTPLYVNYQQDVLTVSWRYEDTIKNIAHIAPDLEFCRLFIQYGALQTRNQIIRDTFNFWPGEQLKCALNKFSFASAPQRNIPSPTPVREDAMVCGAFFDIIKAGLARYTKKTKKPLVELSGGLDSSTLALAAGCVLPQLFSYGLIQMGIMGEQQKKRRFEIVGLANARDHEYPANSCPPFAGLNLPECQRAIFDDNHRPGCISATDAHPEGPFDLLIAGIGGDELMMEHTYTRSEWEVEGTVCTSTAVAGAGRADMFMRRGIWPINPLGSLDVIDFCRSLPQEYRKDRMLIKLNLARQGVSDGFLFPRIHEHYGETMRDEMIGLDIESMLSSSIICSYGILNLLEMTDEARWSHYKGFDYTYILKLWNIAKIDKVLGSYLS